MLDDILPYYENSLRELKSQASALAVAYPKQAHGLGIYAEGIESEELNAVLQGVALMNARVEKKLAHSESELASKLLQILKPQQIKARPAFAVLQCQVDNALVEPVCVHGGDAFQVNEHVTLSCCWDVYLVPLKVVLTQLQPGQYTGQSVLEWRLAFNHADAMTAVLDFCIPEQTVLHDALLQHVAEIEVWQGAAQVTCLSQKDLQLLIGSVLPIDAREIEPTLAHFSAFPQAFSFLRLNLGDVLMAQSGEELRLVFKFNKDLSAERVSESGMLLNCVPTINLLKKMCQPLRYERGQVDYQLVTDVHQDERYFIWDVTQVDFVSDTGKASCLSAFYQMNVGSYERQGDVLSLVDLGDEGVLSIDTWVSEGDALHDVLCQPGGIHIMPYQQELPVRQIQLLGLPTPYVPEPRGDTVWDAVSTIALDYAQLLTLDSLRAFLSVYHLHVYANALLSVTSEPFVQSHFSNGRVGFAQGIQVVIQMRLLLHERVACFGYVLHQYLQAIAPVHTHMRLTIQMGHEVCYAG